MKPESISFRLIGEAINDLLTWLAEDRFAAGVVVGGAIGIGFCCLTVLVWG